MSFSPLFAENTSPFDKDQATLSNYSDIRTTHIDLDWTIDWDQKVISGHATLKLSATKDLDEIVLDSSYLNISRVEVGGEKVDYEHGERNGAMGEGLTIKLNKGLKSGQVSLRLLSALAYRHLSALADRLRKCKSRWYTRPPRTARLSAGSTQCKFRYTAQMYWTDSRQADQERQVPVPLLPSSGRK
jgi:hypothetical protein